ncbi:MAG: glycosyltransferase family 4 protein [Salinibacter sp.]
MEAVLHNYGRALSNDFTLELVTGEKDLPDRLQRQYTCYRVSGFRRDPASLRYAWFACRRYVKSRRPDVLMNIGQSVLGWAVASVGNGHDVATVVRVTGDQREAGLGQSLSERVKSLILHRQFVVSSCHKATGVLTVGPNGRHQLIKQGVMPEKIVALPQPFDPQPFRPPDLKTRNRIKRELGLAMDRPVILFIGRLSWLKGADRLLAMVNRLNQLGNLNQFCIVGSGEYERQFRQFPKEQVHVAGKVPHAEIAPYYWAADKLVVPSRTEGLPNVILEATAAKLPVVATPVGEIPYYVTHITDRRDIFVRYIQDEDLACDRLPDYFDWDRQQQAYVDFFERMITR